VLRGPGPGSASNMAGEPLQPVPSRKTSSMSSTSTVEWVDNSAADACMSCHARFGVMQLRRKHHCRRCGQVVCRACSSAREIVPEYHPIKPQRVCVACVSDRVETQESEEAAESVVTAVRSGKRGNRPVRVNALGGMALPSYDDKKHEFGTLKVRIIEAKGLLAADYGLMNKSSDPYCLVTAGHSVQVRTHTVSATLEPRWDTTLSFRLSRPDDILHLEVWDEDTTSRDDAIGFLDLPLSQVPLSSSSAPLRGWVPLCRPEAQALPGEVVNLPAKGAGAVLLQVQLVDVEQFKLFKAFAAPFPAVPQPPPPFDVDAVYGPAMHLVDLLWTRFFSPILFWLLDLIFWTSPIRSLVALILWNLGARYGLPHYPALPPFGLLCFMVYNRLKREKEPEVQEQAQPPLRRHRSLLRKKSAPALPEEDAVHPQPPLSRQDSALAKDYDEAQLGSAVQRLCFVLPSSIKDLCRGLQPLLRTVADGLQMVHDIFEWEHSASPAAAIVLIVCTVVSEVLRFDILLMLIGSAVLLVCSPLVPAVSGTIGFLSYRTAQGRPKVWGMQDEYNEEWSSKDYRDITATTSAQDSPQRPRLRHAFTKA